MLSAGFAPKILDEEPAPDSAVGKRGLLLLEVPGALPNMLGNELSVDVVEDESAGFAALSEKVGVDEPEDAVFAPNILLTGAAVLVVPGAAMLSPEGLPKEKG